MESDLSGITELTRGDESDARELRTNLARFARQTDSAQIRKLVSEVLQGKRSVRDVFRTPEFNEVVSKRLANVETGLARLTDEERAEVWRRDREPTSPETVRALMDGAETPPVDQAAPAEDDEDFSEQDPLAE